MLFGHASANSGAPLRSPTSRNRNRPWRRRNPVDLGFSVGPTGSAFDVNVPAGGNLGMDLILKSGFEAAPALDPNELAEVPHPCVRVQWLVPALRVKVNLAPVILQTSVGLCLAADQAPQGPPMVSATQPRVIGT